MPSELPTGQHLLRWTIWQSERGDAIQLSLCLLDELWEPLREETASVGPFDDLAEIREALLVNAERWFAIYGAQLSLL